MQNLSIVIPCKNEEAYIEATLRSLNLQDAIEGTEVIIADGGSTDKTLSIIEAIKPDLCFDVKVIEGGSVAIGRNAGAAIAKSDYVLFLDADAIIPKSDTILEAYRERIYYDLITCKVSCSTSFRANLMFRMFNTMRNWMPETFSTGMFMLIYKPKFLELGGFDTTVHHSEDYLLSRNIHKDDFLVIDRYVEQDDRRFKKMGYFGMIKMMFKGWIHRNNIEYFRKNINYW